MTSRKELDKIVADLQAEVPPTVPQGFEEVDGVLVAIDPHPTAD